ncbi:hypothetical protein EST38_g9225 [Candolleomyces aberdarensis]|uniref:Uncharacterized protein n=1 Tax=Candolleomyces aberdarensis TaxID=2316362 RepID=A0A4Q2DDD4_9AGAR|nr:hypothetical protein EST38_g9225 [Candolleomyces aberdarensis]
MCVDSSSSAPTSESGSDAGDEESPVTFTPLPIPPWHRLKRAEVVFERGDLPESELSLV